MPPPPPVVTEPPSKNRNLPVRRTREYPIALHVTPTTSSNNASFARHKPPHSRRVRLIGRSEISHRSPTRHARRIQLHELDDMRTIFCFRRTVGPLGRATVLLHGHRQLTGVRVESRRRARRGRRRGVTRAWTTRRCADRGVISSGHAVQHLSEIGRSLEYYLLW